MTLPTFAGVIDLWERRARRKSSSRRAPVIPPKAGIHGRRRDDVAHVCRCQRSTGKAGDRFFHPPKATPATLDATPCASSMGPAFAGVTGLRQDDNFRRTPTPSPLSDILERSFDYHSPRSALCALTRRMVTLVA
jgi:hypothetical protein